MLGSFLFLYAILALYGTSLLYREVRGNGCDPSGSVTDNEICGQTGADVFGAMLGVAFAAQGISQFGNFGEALASARVAAYEALKAINRSPGTEQVVIYKADEDTLSSSAHSRRSSKKGDLESADFSTSGIKAILPKFEIDSTSREGLKPNIQGNVSFQDVHFSYPTRPDDTVLDGLSVEIPAGKTVAFVGTFLFVSHLVTCSRRSVSL